MDYKILHDSIITYIENRIKYCEDNELVNGQVYNSWKGLRQFIRMNEEAQKMADSCNNLVETMKGNNDAE
jgi:tetrahydromethanopterin S-methyltransferase subunit H